MTFHQAYIEELTKIAGRVGSMINTAIPKALHPEMNSKARSWSANKLKELRAGTWGKTGTRATTGGTPQHREWKQKAAVRLQSMKTEVAQKGPEAIMRKYNLVGPKAKPIEDAFEQGEKVLKANRFLDKFRR